MDIKGIIIIRKMQKVKSKSILKPRPQIKGIFIKMWALIKWVTKMCQAIAGQAQPSPDKHKRA